ncbi:MAG: hypothetical protein WDO73_12735 [Ignavibacteriota bacterium]
MQHAPGQFDFSHDVLGHRRNPALGTFQALRGLVFLIAAKVDNRQIGQSLGLFHRKWRLLFE